MSCFVFRHVSKLALTSSLASCSRVSPINQHVCLQKGVFSFHEKCRLFTSYSNICLERKVDSFHASQPYSHRYDLGYNRSFKFSTDFLSKSGSGVSQLRYFGSSPSCDEDTPKPSLYARFKKMYKEYWYVLVPVHIATSVVWFASFYYLAVSGVDVVHFLEVIGVPESWVEPLKNSKAGPWVSAYTMYKIATPARYTVTLGGTTLSINHLQKLGVIKPIPNKDKLKEIYQEKKTALRGGLKRTIGETKDEFKKTTTEIKHHYKEARQGLVRSREESQYDFKNFKEDASFALKEWAHVGKLFKNAAVNSVKGSFNSKRGK